MLSKQETDNLILSQVSANDNQINQTYFRNTSNSHPKDCSCSVCKTLKFSDTNGIAENNLKNQLDWFSGDLV